MVPKFRVCKCYSDLTKLYSFFWGGGTFLYFKREYRCAIGKMPVNSLEIVWHFLSPKQKA